MQKLFENLRRDLEAFVEQREALTLVLWAKSQTDTFFAFKTLQAMDEVSQRDVFVLLAEDCFDPVRYVDALMTACDMDIESGNAAIRGGLGDEGAEPWDGLPRDCFDDRRPSIVRLRGLVTHIRRYYPDPVHRIVLAFLPAQLSNPAAYASFANELIPRRGFEPWMAGVRVILTDVQRGGAFAADLARENPFGTLMLPIDFSADAVSRAVVEQANDPATPIEQRMLAFTQVAALDHAWRRYDEAVRKYGVAYRHYLGAKNEPMQGTCLLFAGYSLERMERNDEARERFRQALELAISSDIKQLMLNAMMALGALHQRELDWGSAATYWEGAAYVAKSLQHFFALSDCAENAGVCQIAINDTGKALELWEAGKIVAQQVSYWDRAVSILSHMVEIEERSGMHEARRRHADELAAAQREQAYQRGEVAGARAAAQGGGQPS